MTSLVKSQASHARSDGDVSSQNYPEWLARCSLRTNSATPPACRNRSPEGCVDLARGRAKRHFWKGTALIRRTSKLSRLFVQSP